jgi:hypothetical protein
LEHGKRWFWRLECVVLTIEAFQYERTHAQLVLYGKEMLSCSLSGPEIRSIPKEMLVSPGISRIEHPDHTALV